MFCRVSRARRAIVCTVFGLGFIGLHGMVNPATAQEKQQTPAVIKVKELSPERFQELLPTLPDYAELEADGKRMTVGEFRKRLETQRAAAQACP